MLRTDLPEIITETLPGPKAQAIIDRRAQAVPNAIRCAYPVVIERGEGAMIEDVDGNKFLDWIGGVGVLNIGFSQPEVVEAVKAQADKYFHGMFNVVTHEGYVALAEKLSGIAPVKGDSKKAFFANSGAEADEYHRILRCIPWKNTFYNGNDIQESICKRYGTVSSRRVPCTVPILL